MKKLFDVPDSYKEHITKFDSSDGFLALGIIICDSSIFINRK